MKFRQISKKYRNYKLKYSKLKISNQTLILEKMPLEKLLQNTKNLKNQLIYINRKIYIYNIIFIVHFININLL